MDGVTLKAIRDDREETQPEFAAVLNKKFNRRYDKSKVSRWESGEEKIPADVAHFVTLDQLVFKRSPDAGCCVISVGTQKGGVSKSFLTGALGFVLAHAGARCLCIDCDSQANLTFSLGIGRKRVRELDASGHTLYHALTGKTPVQEVILKTSIERLDIIPSSISLAVAERELVEQELHVDIQARVNGRVRDILSTVTLSAADRATIERALGDTESGTGKPVQANRRLREVLREVRNQYDFILLDCMPSLGILTLNALHASNCVIVPVQTESYSIVGLDNLIATIGDVRKRNPGLHILGVIPTMFNGRQSQDRASLEEIVVKSGKLGIPMFEPIPRSAAIAQAAASNVIAYDVDIGTPGLATFLEIARALFARVNGAPHGSPQV